MESQLFSASVLNMSCCYCSFDLTMSSPLPLSFSPPCPSPSSGTVRLIQRVAFVSRVLKIVNTRTIDTEYVCTRTSLSVLAPLSLTLSLFLSLSLLRCLLLVVVDAVIVVIQRPGHQTYIAHSINPPGIAAKRCVLQSLTTPLPTNPSIHFALGESIEKLASRNDR